MHKDYEGQLEYLAERRSYLPNEANNEYLGVAFFWAMVTHISSTSCERSKHLHSCHRAIEGRQWHAYYACNRRRITQHRHHLEPFRSCLGICCPFPNPTSDSALPHKFSVTGTPAVILVVTLLATQGAPSLVSWRGNGSCQALSASDSSACWGLLPFS